MRSKGALISFALLLTALLVVPMVAAEEKKETSLQFTGEVVSVDVSAKAITVHGENDSSSTFKVDASTKITREGKTISIEELKSGDKVSVTYEKQAEANVALMIGVMSPGKA